MTKRKRFNQTSILKKLDAHCEKCGISARVKNTTLTLHHKNYISNDDDWKNIVIYCRQCHSIVEGNNKKKRDLR